MKRWAVATRKTRAGRQRERGLPTPTRVLRWGRGKPRCLGGAVGAGLGQCREIRVEVGCVMDGLWPCMRALQRRATSQARSSTRGCETDGAQRRPCRGHSVAFSPRRHGARRRPSISTGNLAPRRAALPCAWVQGRRDFPSQPRARQRRRVALFRLAAFRFGAQHYPVAGPWRRHLTSTGDLPHAPHAPCSTAWRGPRGGDYGGDSQANFVCRSPAGGRFSSLMATRKELPAHARAVSGREDGPSGTPSGEAARPFSYGAAFSRRVMEPAWAARAGVAFTSGRDRVPKESGVSPRRGYVPPRSFPRWNTHAKDSSLCSSVSTHCAPRRQTRLNPFSVAPLYCIALRTCCRRLIHSQVSLPSLPRHDRLSYHAATRPAVALPAALRFSNASRRPPPYSSRLVTHPLLRNADTAPFLARPPKPFISPSRQVSVLLLQSSYSSCHLPRPAMPASALKWKRESNRKGVMHVRPIAPTTPTAIGTLLLLLLLSFLTRLQFSNPVRVPPPAALQAVVAPSLKVVKLSYSHPQEQCNLAHRCACVSRTRNVIIMYTDDVTLAFCVV